MANANEFVITEHKCEMCKSYGPSAECTMNIEGKVIARFWLCIGCQEAMYEVCLRYVNNENFKERYTMWRGDEKQFRLEGLTRLMMRLMSKFLAAYAEFEKGEEK